MEKIGTLAWFNIFAEVEKKLKEEKKPEVADTTEWQEQSLF